jgi:hypothetical protein
MDLVAAPFRMLWLSMLVPPWSKELPHDTDGERYFHIAVWLTGWTWVLAGIVFGSVVSPYLFKVWALSNSSYRDWFVVVVATIACFLVQALGLMLISLMACIGILFYIFASIFLASMGIIDVDGAETLAVWSFVSSVFIGALLPLIAVGYGIYLYAATVGTQAGLVTTGVIGGVLVKLAITLGAPVVKGAIFGFLFARFMIWLRGNRQK